MEHLEIAESEATKNWLDSAIVPIFSLKDASREEAVAQLSKDLEAAPGKPKGIHIKYASKEETKHRYHREITSDAPSHIPDLELIPSPEDHEKEKDDKSNEKLTLALTDV